MIKTTCKAKGCIKDADLSIAPLCLDCLKKILSYEHERDNSYIIDEIEELKDKIDEIENQIYALECELKNTSQLELEFNLQPKDILKVLPYNVEKYFIDDPISVTSPQRS